MWMVMLAGSWQPADTDAVVFEWMRTGMVGPETPVRHSSWTQPAPLRTVPAFWEHAQRLLQQQGAINAAFAAHRWAEAQRASATKAEFDRKARETNRAIATYAALFVVGCLVLWLAWRSTWLAVAMLVAFIALTIVGFLAATKRVSLPSVGDRLRASSTVASLASVLLVSAAGLGLVGSRQDAAACDDYIVAVRERRVAIPPEPDDTAAQWDEVARVVEGAEGPCVDSSAARKELADLRAEVAKRGPAAGERQAAADAQAKKRAEALEERKAAEARKARIARFPERVPEIEKKLNDAAAHMARNDPRSASAALDLADADLQELDETEAAKNPQFKRLRARLASQRAIVEPAFTAQREREARSVALITLGWSDAETLLKNMGYSTRPGADPEALRAEGRDPLIVVRYSRQGSTAPPVCLSILQSVGDNAQTLARLTGADTSSIPSHAARLGRAFTLNTARGPMPVRFSQFGGDAFVGQCDS
jgi:hypothetical protein